MTVRILAAVALAATLVVNFLANALPIAGRTTGEVSDSFPVLFVPAGYVFAIWGLIYLGLIAFVVYQFLPAIAAKPCHPALQPTFEATYDYPRLNLWFILSCFFNSLWIFAWHYGYYGVTPLLMLGLLVSLIALYQELEASRARGDIILNLVLVWALVGIAAKQSDTPVVMYAAVAAAVLIALAIFLRGGWRAREVPSP